VQWYKKTTSSQNCMQCENVSRLHYQCLQAMFCLKVFTYSFLRTIGGDSRCSLLDWHRSQTSFVWFDNFTVAHMCVCPLLQMSCDNLSFFVLLLKSRVICIMHCLRGLSEADGGVLMSLLP